MLARQTRRKIVDEVVRDAVHGYLEHSSFGDVDDVVLALARARIDAGVIAHHAGELSALRIEGSGERSNRGETGAGEVLGGFEACAT